jgi:peptidoglycan hydrolase CwlO-like protein
MKKIFQSELFWEVVIGFVIWIISFLIVSWLVEGSFWLHFFLSSSGSYVIVNSTKREITQKLVPIFQSLDDNINSLHEKTQSLEEEIETLRDKIQNLEFRIDDFEDKTSPIKYGEF